MKIYRLGHAPVCRRQPAMWMLAAVLLFPGFAAAQFPVSLSRGETGGAAFSYRRDTGAILDDIRQGQNLHPDSGLVLFNRALQSAREADFPVGIITALKNISSVYAEKSMYHRSLAALREAIPYCNRSAEAMVLLPQLYGGIGTIYQFQNNYQEAARYYYQAILMAEQLPPSRRQWIANIYNNMAEFFNLFGEPDLALEYLKKAEVIAIQQQELYLLESILVNRGIIYLDQKRWKEGQEHFQHALYLGHQYKLDRLQHSSLLNLADVYLEKKLPGKALFYIQEAMSVTDNITPSSRNGGIVMLGNALYQLGLYRQAEDTLLAALKRGKELSAVRQIRIIYGTLADLYAATGQYQQAFHYHKQYVALKDSITNQHIANNINVLEKRFRIAEKDKELYQKQLLINQQKQRIERKNVLIIGITTGILVLSALLASLYRNRRHKQQIGQLKAMMKGEEKERNRIGRELHDGIGGMLTAINMNLGAIQKRHQALPEMKDLDMVTAMLQDMAVEIRKTSHNLMPDILLRHGFPETLRMYCEQVSSSSNLQIDLHCYGELDELDGSLAFSLYRILQEIIQNIIKHASASQAVIQIRQHEERLSITVEDNGKGFDTRHAHEGAGLKNIRSRAQALYGHIAIESAIGRGTAIYIAFDLQKMNNN